MKRPAGHHGWIVLPLMAAAMCIAVGALCSASALAAWFHHPMRQPLPETTVLGARLTRIMLFICAAALVTGPLVLLQRSPKRDEPNDRTKPPESSRVLWGLLGLMLVAIIVRGGRITESLWYDEVAAWSEFGQYGPGAIVGNWFDPVNHTAYTLLSWLSFQYVDADVIGLRLPALLFSLLTIPAMFILVREAATQRAGWIAATLSAVLAVLVLEGIESRGYSMMICGAATAHWLLLRALQTNLAGAWMLYAGICALSIWAHPMAAFVPIGHGLVLVYHIFRARSRAAVSGLIALLIAAVMTLTLYAPLIPDMLQIRGTFSASSSAQPGLFGVEGTHTLLQMGGSWYWWAALPGLVLAVVGLVAGLREHRSRRSIAVAFAGLLAMVFCFIVCGWWMYARFAMFVVPGAVLLIALGVDLVWKRSRSSGMIALGIVMAASLADLLVRPPKQPLREAAAHVIEQFGRDAPIVIVGLRHEAMRPYLSGPRVYYSLLHGVDLVEKLDTLHPLAVVIYYPHNVTEQSYRELDARGYKLAVAYEGWVDWTNGDVLVYERSATR